jgi:hypothetical protein
MGRHVLADGASDAMCQLWMSKDVYPQQAATVLLNKVWQ